MFTTAEYISKHHLDVDVQDPWATKLINKHLRRLGYERIRKNNRWFWVKREASPASTRAGLEAKLTAIEEGMQNGES